MAGSVNKYTKIVGNLKAKNQLVEAKSKTVYGIANSYKTTAGEIVAVGFTSTDAYLFNYDGKYVNIDLLKEVFQKWMPEDEYTLDDVVNYENTELIVVRQEDGSFTRTGAALNGLFEESVLLDIEKRCREIAEIASGEVELTPQEMHELMNE